MEDLQVGRFLIPDSEIIESFTTSGGPGGQHANRSSTAVEIRFDVAASQTLPEAEKNLIVERLGTVVTVSASESRSQWRNRAVARRRLAERLAEAMKTTPRRRPTRPTGAARRQRLDSKRRQSEKKRLRRKPEY